MNAGEYIREEEQRDAIWERWVNRSRWVNPIGVRFYCSQCQAFYRSFKSLVDHWEAIHKEKCK